MKLSVQKNYEALSRECAKIIRELVASKPNCVLGLATGSTPVGTYEQLIHMYDAGDVDFSRVTAFNLDEYFPIKKSSDQSYYHFMRKNLFDRINIAQTFIPDGEAPDAAAECAAYEEKIAAHGGIDLQILGIGNNGHIGFNEPGDAFVAATNYTPLDESTIKANARFFADESEVPRYAVTMGIRTIFRAGKIILLASGAGKADAIFKALHGPITPQMPASVLQLHPDVTVIVDEDAAGLVK
ncbi:MAG: glucosamine-6-phosphate deaminase [Defluviitaleaceae bacterium]|nr:glucosamine-6-phosphate deaminase [Defluviitaleaceae bacterium]